MTLEHLMMAMIPILLAGLILGAWKDSKASAQRLGARLGEFEAWMNQQIGEQRARKEGHGK